MERYFPRENDLASLDDKDRSGVQNSALEVFAIAADLVTLHAHHVEGPFLEFGCFKGFSTAILSDACHQLGIVMHVFDSFSGLPPSDSSYYHEGEFAGSLPEVRCNVVAYGRPQPIVFHEGFFADTLSGFTEPHVMCLWMDVDLESSSADVMARAAAPRPAWCAVLTRVPTGAVCQRSRPGRTRTGTGRPAHPRRVRRGGTSRCRAPRRRAYGRILGRRFRDRTTVRRPRSSRSAILALSV